MSADGIYMILGAVLGIAACSIIVCCYLLYYFKYRTRAYLNSLEPLKLPEPPKLPERDSRPIAIPGF